MNRKSILFNVDLLTLGIYLALILIGWFSIYAAVYDVDHSSIFDLDKNYGKQLIWIFTAMFLAMLILILDYKFFSTFSYVFYGITLLLLIGVLFVGRLVGGNQAWFEIGSFRLQPSEFAKFATCMALAKYLSGTNIKMQQLSTKIASISLLVIPFVLIMLQPDAGSASTFLGFVLVLYREGLSGIVLIIGFGIIVIFLLALMVQKLTLLIAFGIIAGLFIYFFRKSRKAIAITVSALAFSVLVVFGVDYTIKNVLKPHQSERINNLVGIDVDLKGAGYNVNQSMIAIGSGGFLGKGFLQGTQTKYDFVPEQSTDFIFCTIGEEYGFVGSFVVIALFVTLLLRIIFIAERQRFTYSRIYAYGVFSILFFHFTINLGMTIGLIPVIGIPLPFISYGGSSLWSFTILLFILLKLDANRMGLLR